MNKFGFNIQFADTANEQECLARMSQFRPKWCLTYSVNDAIKLRDAGVENVAVRLYEDGGVNEKHDLDWIINKYQNVFRNGFWVELTNEYISVSWLQATIEPLLKLGWKILAPAFASGTPEPKDWPLFKFMCELARDYPNFMFSVHEYFPSVPFNLKIAQWNVTINLPKFDVFDPDKDTNPWSKYLMAYNGRFEQFANAWCDKWNLPHPKYVVTEAGRAPQRNDPNSVVNSGGYTTGWRALNDWYATNFPGSSGAEVYAMMNCWLVDVFYGPSPTCQSYILFNYDDKRNLPKNSQNDWSGFCVARDVDFWKYYTKWVNMIGTTTNPVPEFFVPVLVRAAGTVLTYFHPVPLSKASGGGIIGSFDPKIDTPVGVDLFGSVFNDGLFWLRVKKGQEVGFVSFADVTLTYASDATEAERQAFMNFESAFLTYKTVVGV